MSMIKTTKMIKLKDILLEVEKPKTKIFDQGALQDSMKQIRKLVGIEEADEKWDEALGNGYQVAF